MGIFTTPKQGQSYVPPLDDDGSVGTVLGGQSPASNDWLSKLTPADTGFVPKDTGADSSPADEPNTDILPVADPTEGQQAPVSNLDSASQSVPQSSMGKRGVAPPTEPPLGTPLKDGPGQPVTLPDGSSVPDRYSPTGKLMSPVGDLSDVAVEGRKAGDSSRMLRRLPGGATAAIEGDLFQTGFALGHGGKFDYQRGPGNSITGFEQRPQFRNVSNVNVGLFAQQAGLSLDDVLSQAGWYARIKSKNYAKDQPYGLDTQTREYMELGYKIGESGVFGPAAKRW